MRREINLGLSQRGPAGHLAARRGRAEHHNLLAAHWLRPVPVDAVDAAQHSGALKVGRVASRFFWGGGGEGERGRGRACRLCSSS